MMARMQRIGWSAFGGMMLIAVIGCASPAGIAVQLVGKAVDDVDTKQLGDSLVGKAPRAADEKLGQTLDVWQQVGGPREWRVYPVSMDVLGNQRYIVQIGDNRIVAVTKVKIDSSGIELARKLLYDEKVKGKTPQECQAALNFGPPIVTARNEKTGLIAQLYDAQMVPGVGSRQYCRLRFDANQRCNESALMDVSASTKSDPAR